MPLPVLFPGHDPTATPGTARIATFGQGVSGGSGGEQPNPIRAGVNIAFGSPANAEAPLWQLLNELGS